MNPSDQSLVERAGEGDAAAIRCLLLRHHDSMLRLIQSSFPESLRSVADVEDVLQVTLAEIADRIGDFVPQSEQSVGAWFRTIAKRNLTDLIRYHRAAKRGGGRQPAANRQSDSASLSQLLIDKSAITASHVVSQEEAMAAVEVAIEQLPEEYQVVIRMRLMDDQSFKEIAEQVGRSESAARSIYFRAIQDLRQAIGRLSRYFG